MRYQNQRLADSPIHYWVSGPYTRTCVMFLHPAFVDHTCFDDQVEVFGQAHRVVVPDLLGHGQSLGKGSIVDTAAHIAAMVDAEGCEQVHLVGVSLGAVLAADFANHFPAKLASLACIGGYDINHFDAELQKANSSQQGRMILTGMLSIRRFAEKNKQISAYTLQGQERFYQMNVKFKKSSFRYLADLGKIVNKSETPMRDYPMLIGVGEHDNPNAIAATKQWAQRESDVRLVIFPGAGHVVNLDTPEAFNGVIEELIQKAEN